MPAITRSPEAPSRTQVLARVVLPVDGRALPLYVDGADPDTPTTGAVLDRRRLLVPAGERVSFATWFAAFPAGWWARHTDVREVRLDVELSGPGEVRLLRSDGDGRVTSLPGLVAPLDPAQEPAGGWLWFEVHAGTADVVVERADWCTGPGEPAAVPLHPASMTLAMTTYDRPSSAVGVLRRLAEEPAVLSFVDEVVVVDQGTSWVSADPGFPAVRVALGDRLRVVEQPNLGGSGGFARGMLEALQADRSRYVVLLDDDIAVEPESLRRALVFADRCRTPTLVSVAMLDLVEPTVLHTPGERIDRPRFLWETVPPGRPDSDLAVAGLRTAPWLHRHLDVDFGGWWCCLVPTAVLREVGLAVPLFIKWDDVELALRAGAAGFPTAALPGAGVWHEPWTGKADTLDWHAYFHQRNRLAAALLHSPTRRGLRLLAESLEWTLVPLVSMRYAVVALRLRALEDLLAGPQDLPASLATRIGEVRTLQASYVDGRPVPRRDGLPLPAVPAPGSRTRALLRLGWEVLRTAVRSAPPGPPVHTAAPDEATLWRLARVDSALVSTATGTTAEHRRDAVLAADLLRRTLVLHARVLARWPSLRTAYRRALPELVSPQTWTSVFGLPAAADADPVAAHLVAAEAVAADGTPH